MKAASFLVQISNVRSVSMTVAPFSVAASGVVGAKAIALRLRRRFFGQARGQRKAP